MISILVPTLGRPWAIGPLACNVADVTPAGVYELVFVVDHDDQDSREAAEQAGGMTVVVVHDGTYPVKIHAAYEASSMPFVVPTADDVVFHEGWYEAFEAAIEDGVDVLGTSDLTPITADGRHATMPIIRRSYIEEPGAAWAETGTVFHRGYHHGWVETETCQLAMHRGVWKFTDRCVIEHKHPDWGTRPADETDRKGNQAHKGHDYALFTERQRQWQA